MPSTAPSRRMHAPEAVPHPRLRALSAVAILSLGALGCLGCLSGPYRTGAASLYAPDVHTVYVPMFESASFRRNLGERLTEAVIKRIEDTTTFKVVNTSNADSVLYGKLVNDTKRVVVENLYDDPRDLEINFQVLVTWTNRKGDAIREAALPAPPPSIDLGARADIIPEYGRSDASTQQEVIDRLAAQIVGLMEAPW